MDSADFYTYDVERKNGSLVWLGSVKRYGSPFLLSAEVLIQNNTECFEIELDEFLSFHPFGVKPQDGWPWDWNDSRMTDYNYIYAPHLNKIIFSMMHGDLHKKAYDPIKIKQGFSLDEAYVHDLKVNTFKSIFPNMKEEYLIHGYEYPNTL
jgi:hypothetical protein